MTRRVKRLHEISEEDLYKAVGEMCRNLGISGSVLGAYNLYDAVLQERSKDRNAKQWWDGRRKHWRNLLSA